MLRQSPRPFGSIALVATLLILGVGVTMATDPARADDCLTAPNSPAPQGSHWYYRLDRASQRKCWYVRTAGHRVQQAALPSTEGPATSLYAMPAPAKPLVDVAPMLVSAGDTTQPMQQVEIHAVKPNTAPVSSTTTDNNASSIPWVPAPQPSTSLEISAEAVTPAPTAPGVWRAAPRAFATIQAPEPIAAPTDASTDSASDNAERIGHGGEPSYNAGMQMIIFLFLALGLALVGTLARDFMKIAAARRERVTAKRM
jgi:hypothetical protein